MPLCSQAQMGAILEKNQIEIYEEAAQDEPADDSQPVADEVHEEQEKQVKTVTI